MMDECLYTSKSPQPTVLWRPGNGRRITKSPNMYQSFTHTVRTVHVKDALDICSCQRMCPKPVISLSSIRQKRLPGNHPCRNLRVLWFGTKQCGPEIDEDDHDWYGNVQFVLPARLLLERWKFCYLVEIMSAPTHTASRILITNTDYSAVLPRYNPYKEGGPWWVNSNGNLTLSDCLRYNNEGRNMHGHTLEFMVEVTTYDQKRILDECEISFRNHSKAGDKSQPHVCHRFQKLPEPCPTPVTAAVASEMFFEGHQSRYRQGHIAKPRLSRSGEHYLHRYLKTNIVPQAPSSAVFPTPPPAFTGPMVCAPQPCFYVNQQTWKHVLRFPNGLITGHNHILIYGLNLRGPLTDQQLGCLYYVSLNIYRAHFSGQLQRHRQDTNDDNNNEKRDTVLPEVENQGHPVLFQQPPLSHSQLDPLRQVTAQNPPGPIPHTWSPSHPPASQHNGGPVQPTKLQQTWDKGQPAMLQHNLRSVHSLSFSEAVRKRA